MERNGGFRPKNNSSFSPRGRGNDFRKPWRPNFNSNQHNAGGNSWFQNNQQSMQNPNQWDNQSNSNSGAGWGNNAYSNEGNWNQPTNQAWPNQNSNDQGYWKQVSSSNNQPAWESGSWQQYNNPNRDRRTPYDRPDRGRPNRPNRGGRPQFNYEPRRGRDREPSPEIEPDPVPLTPLEAKIERLITAVQSQPDNLGQLILLQNNNEIPPVLLNNAAHQVKNCTLTIDRNESTGYSKLRINNTVIAEGKLVCSYIYIYTYVSLGKGNTLTVDEGHQGASNKLIPTGSFTLYNRNAGVFYQFCITYRIY